VRSIAVLTICAAAAGFVVLHELPENEAEADGRASRPQEVQSVALDGYGLPVAELRAALATHAGDTLDAAKLEHDRSALEAVLVDRGYLSAHVQAAHEMFDSNGGAFVTFAIAQGPVFHVRSVEVTGAPERDAGIVTIAKGEVVRADLLEHARAAMAERLVARGIKLAGASVAVEMRPDEAAAVVDVVLSAR
jgi:outer membrane protein assembly factor BamA